MNHAENLLPCVDQLLKKKKLTLRDIKTFLIGRGPGSFTGLRVGFATLKGFLALGNHHCYGALSLDMIAENIPLAEGSTLSIALDAHRDKVYARLYQRIKGSWKPKSKPQTLTLEAWLKTLPSKIHLAGDAVQRYRSQIDAGGKHFHFLPEKSGTPKASTLIRLFQENPKKLQRLEKPADFIPLYFRLSEAEERLNAKKLQTVLKQESTRHAGHC